VKLYVWEDVLHDYTEGMIVAVAPDLEAALAVVTDSDQVRAEMGRQDPIVITITDDTPAQVFYVYGGG
jgi:hypothetical protein